MWKINMIQMKKFMKQKETHRHRDQTCDCQGGGGLGEGQIRIWDYQMQTTIYRIDKTTRCYWKRYNIFSIL